MRTRVSDVLGVKLCRRHIMFEEDLFTSMKDKRIEIVYVRLW